MHKNIYFQTLEEFTKQITEFYLSVVMLSPTKQNMIKF